MPTRATTAYELPATSPATSVPLTVFPTALFEDYEIEIAEHLAEARLLAQSTDEFYPMASDEPPHVVQTTAVLGELAIRKVLNSKEPVYALGRLDWDVTLRGYRAAVETRHLDPAPYPDLVISADRPLGADIYVLAVRLPGQRVRIVGYCTQESLCNRNPKRLPGGRQALVVPAEELRLLPGGDTER